MIDHKILDYIVNVTDSPIMILNNTGSICWANKGFEYLYGFSFEQYNKNTPLKNQKYVKILSDIDYSFFDINKEYIVVKGFLAKDNTEQWIQSNITPKKDEKGNILGFIVVETNITHQKEIEEELAQQHENSQTLSEHLESVKVYIEGQIKELTEQKISIEKSRQQSEEVLNKLLPYEVALQLKRKGYASPRNYKKVTVLQLCIRNFLQLSEQMPIEELIQQFHEALVSVDTILEQHYVEKIKTTNRIYLGAGGVPLRNRSNPIDVVLAALKIKAIFKQINVERKSEGIPEFEISIGIHTGKAVAGIVGKNKLSYDIWGDAVNISSLVEQNADMDKIIISETTKDYVNEYFICEVAKEINLNTNSVINLYEIKGINEKYTNDKNGILPNNEFLQELSKI